MSSGSRGSLDQPGLSVPGCAGRESRDQAPGAVGLCNLPPLRRDDSNIPLCFSRMWQMATSYSWIHGRPVQDDGTTGVV